MRNTVTKAIANPIPPGYQLSRPRPKPAVDPVRHITDAWFEKDKRQRPKQRHMGQRIYERLRDEHNFKDSPPARKRWATRQTVLRARCTARAVSLGDRPENESTTIR